MKMKKLSLKATGFLMSMLVVFEAHAFFNWDWWPWNTDYTKTKYPIVLVHGAMGFDKALFGGLLPVDYWPGVPGEVMRSGGTVYVAQVSAVSAPETRGEQLIRELETISALTGHEKFNLIGHSFGGPTTRYAAAVRPDLIASVSTTGGSNDTNERDVIDPIEDPGEQECGIVCQTFNILAVIGGITWTEEKCTTDVYSLDPAVREAALISCQAVNEEVANSGLPFEPEERDAFGLRHEAFNRTFSDGRPTEWCGEGAEYSNDGIAYYSWSGTAQITSLIDPSDIVMLIAAVPTLIEGGQTDGLVERCRSRWGKVIRDDYPMNHLDETNMLWGLTAPFFSETGVFRQHANRLKGKGM